MGLVFRGAQSRRSLPSIAFGGAPRIDRSHPLAQGLVGCWLPGLTGGIDLTGTCPTMALTTNSAPYDLGAEGPVLKGAVSTVGGNVLTCLAPPQFKNWNNFSLYYRGPRGTGSGAGSTCPFIDVSYTNGVSSPFTVAGIGDFNGNDMTSVQTGWNDGATEKKGTGVNLSAKTLVSVLGAFTVGGNNLLYSDGLQVASDLWSNSTQSTTSVTDTININGWLATARYTPSQCNIACAWNRTLSASEAALLDADPYGFLIPAEGEMPTLFVAAAGGSFIPAWALNSNLPVIGTGTY